MTDDEAYRGWTTDELRGMYRARVRNLLLLEARDGPTMLRRRQEALCRQAWRLLRRRGVEVPFVRSG